MRRFLLALAASFVLVPGAAQAQDAAAQKPADKAEKKDDEVVHREEVVVRFDQSFDLSLGEIEGAVIGGALLGREHDL